jgi:hypothetical protein
MAGAMFGTSSAFAMKINCVDHPRLISVAQLRSFCSIADAWRPWAQFWNWWQAWALDVEVTLATPVVDPASFFQRIGLSAAPEATRPAEID